MGFMSAKETRTNTGSSSSGMGLLLVFFPDHNSRNSTPIAVDTPSLLPSSSSSSSSSSPATFSRSRSSGLLISKAQSTISICALLLFLTLFLFTLSTFEPSATTPAFTHRRFLLKRDVGARIRDTHVARFALQGMGSLFLRGTKAMHDLVVTHVAVEATPVDVRLFLRLLHRSGVTSRADVVFLFSSASSASRFDGVIREENDSFLRLVDAHRHLNSTSRFDPVLGFDVTRFVKNHETTETVEPLWGKKSGGGGHRVGNESAVNETGSSTLTHGSVVGFDANELDPENSLSGFLDHVPLSLRRWACYPMLLGRVRRNFKHVMLTDAKRLLFIGDPLTRVRNRSPDSVLVFSKHNSKKNSVVSPAILMGGAKGVRRLSNAMLTEIVRTAIQHKKKNSVSDTAVLSQLVGNMHITKNFQVITSNESIPETSSIAELRSRNSAAMDSKNHDIIIQRGNNNNHSDINAVIMKHICSFEFDPSVYSDC